ncbi:MAG: hypothetical protein V3S89_00795 [Desulfobacterales bacterium]
MLSKKPKESSRVDVNKAIERFDSGELVQLVKELYRLSEDNRTFLHARCSAGDDSLTEPADGTGSIGEPIDETDGYYAAAMRRLFADSEQSG